MLLSVLSHAKAGRAATTLIATCTAASIIGCSSDEGPEDGGGSGGSGGRGGSVGVDAAAVVDGAIDVGAGGGSASSPEQRGEYLVHHVAICVDCHTPRNADGTFDHANELSGVECFIDISPDDDAFGCLSAPNLTSDATGLGNRSDDEILAMMLEGVRPNGRALHPVMPYWALGNMDRADAEAIVAYLRTLPPVERQLSAPQAPFDTVTAPAKRLDLTQVPSPDPSSDDYESALRGRYLSASVGICLECHTPDGPDPSVDPRDLSRSFLGGRTFLSSFSLVPVPNLPDQVFSRNLTPHPTGIEGWTVEELVAAIKQGVDRAGDRVCPPMPSGTPSAPMEAYGGLTDEDATDIARYLLSLPPADSGDIANCAL